MTLDNIILKSLIKINKGTPKEIYRDIVENKRFFFTTMTPVNTVNIRCHKLYHFDILDKFIINGQVYYYIKTKNSIKKPEKKTVNSKSSIIFATMGMCAVMYQIYKIKHL